MALARLIKINTFSVVLFSSSIVSAEVDLMSLSLEELGSVKVGSALRKTESLFRSTSATYSISKEDIQTSGASSIAELLQYVPGFQVGRLSSNMWAVNARSPGFRLARQILIMIDGRKVYSPSTNTIFWDRLDTYLPDIERIEITRGPGASLWGTNASNGVVNIVTKSSRETTGLHSYLHAADEHLEHDIGLRWGYVSDTTTGRFYVKSKTIDESIYPGEGDQARLNRVEAFASAHDQQKLTSMGFRTDIDRGKVQFQLSGDYINSETEEVKIFSLPIDEILVEQEGGNALARVNVEHTEKFESTLHFYVDHLHRDTEMFKDTSTLYDFDYQGQIGLDGYAVTWGVGYREVKHNTLNLDTTFGQALLPAKEKLEYESAFIQAEYFITDKSIFSAGIKAEDDPYMGWEFMPNIRLGLYPSDLNTYWFAVAKAIFTPSRSYADGYLNLSGLGDCSAYAGFGAVETPGVGCTIGVDDRSTLNSSSMIAYEVGHRAYFFNNSLLLDHTFFYNEFDDLNSESFKIDRAYGYEISVKHRWPDKINLEIGLNYHKVDDHGTESNEGKSMDVSGFIKFQYHPQKNTHLSVFYRYLDQTDFTDSYDQFGFNLRYDLENGLSLSLIGKDLLDKYHVEPNVDTTRANSLIGRSVALKLEYSY